MKLKQALHASNRIIGRIIVVEIDGNWLAGKFCVDNRTEYYGSRI